MNINTEVVTNQATEEQVVALYLELVRDFSRRDIILRTPTKTLPDYTIRLTPNRGLSDLALATGDASEIYAWLMECRAESVRQQHLESLQSSVVYDGLASVKQSICDAASVGLIAHQSSPDLLVSAARHGDLEIVKYLHAEGWDIHLRNEQAICDASQYGHIDVVAYLLENGADLNNHAKDKCPLDGAMRFRHMEIAQLLVEHGIGQENIRKTIKQAVWNERWDFTGYLLPHLKDIEFNDNELARLACKKQAREFLYQLYDIHPDKKAFKAVVKSFQNAQPLLETKLLNEKLHNDLSKSSSVRTKRLKI
ncbi:Ankyrin repeats (3 copies) [Caballeronia peredens]|nr:Ankyrin repeats (3 copies) [Caballeronia peredens]